MEQITIHAVVVEVMVLTLQVVVEVAETVLVGQKQVAQHLPTLVETALVHLVL